MPLASTTRGYKGKGHVSLRPKNGLGRQFRLGNVINLNETIEVEREGRQNFQEVGGGELDVTETVSSVTAELVVNDIKPQTIAIGLRGSYELEASDTVSDEAALAWPRERVTFARIPDPAEAITVAIDATASWAATTEYAVGDLIADTSRAYIVTVAGESGSVEPSWPTDGTTVSDGTVTWRDIGPVALVQDTDYARTPHGIQMMAASDAKFVGDLALPLTVGYTKNAQYIIQALVNSGEEYEMIFDGLNEVDSGNPMVGRYFRVKFSPTSGFSRIGSEFAELTLSMTVLSDDNRVGSGLSKFMEFAIV